MILNPFLKQRSGIYGIRNLVNSKIYIGRTKDMYKRQNQYISYVKTENKDGQLNRHLYNSICKYGFDKFEFFPLEFCKDDKIKERELFWMKKFRSMIREFGYNLRLDSEIGHMITHPETSAKISKNLKEQWAKGIRDDHARKLALSWSKNPERKKTQSRRMTKTLTKYMYSINGGEPLMYADIKKLGYESVMSSFHRKKTNVVTYKNMEFRRIVIEDIVRSSLKELE